MSTIMRLIGTLVGFSTVMLATSLIVMCLVRLIHYAANSRGKTLGEMLASLNLGFRANQGDIGQPGDSAQSSFVLDVMTYPTLHPAPRLEPLGNAPNVDELQKRRWKVANKVEYLGKDRLLDIVGQIAQPPAGSASDSERYLPTSWSNGLPESKRSFQDFKTYVDTWYATIGDVGTESFKVKSKQLAAVMSCFVVIFLNLDGFRLASDLFFNQPAQDLLASDAEAVLKTADQLGVEPLTGDRDALLIGVSDTLKQMNGVLNEPSLSLGWQKSWIVRKWCGSSGPCWKGFLSAPFETVRWVAGLLFSCVLASLGAPFWSDRLKDLLGFRSALDPTAPKKRNNGSEDGDAADDTA